MHKALIVGLGGFVGSMGRYLVSGAVQRAIGGAMFPYGTLAVNLLGSGLIGLLAAAADTRNVFGPDVRALVFIGGRGGFTTFSSFAYETLALGRDGQTLRATGNVLVTVLGCLLAAWAGGALGRGLWGNG